MSEQPRPGFQQDRPHEAGVGHFFLPSLGAFSRPWMCFRGSWYSSANQSTGTCQWAQLPLPCPCSVSQGPSLTPTPWAPTPQLPPGPLIPWVLILLTSLCSTISTWICSSTLLRLGSYRSLWDEVIFLDVEVGVNCSTFHSESYLLGVLRHLEPSHTRTCVCFPPYFS